MINSKKLLCLILAMILALFCVAAVSCDETPTEPDNGDNGSTDRTEWPEAGVYYFDGEAGENTITLNVSDEELAKRRAEWRQSLSNLAHHLLQNCFPISLLDKSNTLFRLH